MNARCEPTSVSIVSVAVFRVLASVRVSAGPVSSARAVRSPSRSRPAIRFSSRSGRVSRRASSTPLAAAMASTITASVARNPQISHSRSVSGLDGIADPDRAHDRAVRRAGRHRDHQPSAPSASAYPHCSNSRPARPR